MHAQGASLKVSYGPFGWISPENCEDSSQKTMLLRSANTRQDSNMLAVQASDMLELRFVRGWLQGAGLITDLFTA